MFGTVKLCDVICSNVWLIISISKVSNPCLLFTWCSVVCRHEMCYFVVLGIVKNCNKQGFNHLFIIKLWSCIVEWHIVMWCRVKGCKATYCGVMYCEATVFHSPGRNGYSVVWWNSVPLLGH